MWGLAFLNQTLALLGITAATIPIIIHLFFRQRFRRMPFTAVIFLRELQSRVARSLRLHDLLLLILRTLAILFVGLALGQPVLRFTHTALHGIGKRTTALILLDNSYSMARLRNNRPLFEHAKRTCRIIINALRRGDSIALWLVNENIEPQQTAPTVELKSVHRSIDEAKLSLLTTDLSSALNEAYRHMRGIKGANREIYLISDMQAIGWQKLLKGKLKIYSTPEVTLFLVDVAGTNTDNAAVLDARPVDSPPLPERQIMLRATLGNYGAARNATVTLLIDGKAVAYERVNLPPNGRTAITFHYRFDKRGMHWMQVRLDEDALALDDHYWFGMQIEPKVDVLIVEEGFTSRSVFSESFYLRSALNPTRLRSYHPHVRIEAKSINALQLPAIELSDYDAIVLLNISRLSGRALKQLESFVREGGGLLIALGERVNLQFYNRALYRGGMGLLPAPLIAIRSTDPSQPAALCDIANGHPAFRNFDTNFLNYLTAANFYKFIRTRISGEGVSQVRNAPHASDSGLSQSGSVKVIAWFTTGDPALIERKFGDGRVILFTSTLDTDWSNFAIQGSYLPVMHQLLYYLCGQGGQVPRYVIGQVAKLPAMSKIIPLTQEQLLPSLPASQGRWWEIPGIYRASFAPSQLRNRESHRYQYFAINLDRRESNLKRVAIKELRRSLRDATIIYVSDIQRLPKAIRQARRGIELQLAFFIVALLILLIECIFANWLTRRRVLTST